MCEECCKSYQGKVNNATPTLRSLHNGHPTLLARDVKLLHSQVRSTNLSRFVKLKKLQDIVHKADDGELDARNVLSTAALVTCRSRRRREHTGTPYVTIGQVRLSVSFDRNPEVEQGEYLPVKLNYGLKLLPIEQCSPPSSLLFNSPSIEEKLPPPQTALRKDVTELRERDLTLMEEAVIMREQALLKNQDEWKEWEWKEGREGDK